jgi:HEAT repeat protein
MNKRFKQLCDELTGQPPLSYEQLQQITQEMREMGDVSDGLLEILEKQFELKNWTVLHRLFGIMFYLPDKKFTPILCEILDDHKDNVIAEHVVDVLDGIADERSIPCLIRSLEYYSPGDDYRQLNSKIVQALSRIGTTEAIDGIKLALKSDDEIIRRTANEELKRIGR